MPAVSAAVLFFGTLGAIHRAGIWDPPELETAELARRIAQGLLGAEDLGPESPLGVPTRGELGRGELPFTLVGLGFRAFGLSAWAGRLPLALVAIVGAVALYWLVRRLASARAAALAVLVLGTAPLYFLQARTMLGEVVTMAAASAAMSGLALAIFDRPPAASRLAALALGILGCAAGFGARGLLVGVALPTLGVGLAWLLLTLAGARQDSAGAAVGASSLLAGVGASLGGAWMLAVVPPDRYSAWLGAYTSVAVAAPTFETVVRDLGHAFFPWSAALPWAAGRLLGPFAGGASGGAARSSALRMVVLSSAAVTLAGQSLLGAELGSMPYVAPAALAGITALALQDLDFGAPSSRALGLVTGALMLVLLIDFQNFPEKTLVAFGVPDATVPAAFAAGATPWLLAAGVAASAAFFFLVQEANASGGNAFAARGYLVWPHALRRLWGGNLLFGVLLVTSALMALDLMRALAERAPALHRFGPASELSRALVRGGWVMVLALLALPLLVQFGRDVVRAAIWPTRHVPYLARRLAPRQLRFGRGAAATVALAVPGVLASAVYYPALLRELSPKGTLEAYARYAGAEDELGVLGVEPSALRYHARAAIEELSTREQAIEWLVARSPSTDGARRFLLLRRSELAWLNAAFRRRHSPPTNVPILESESSEILLAVNRLRPGEHRHNPLDAFVLERPPRPARALDVDLASKLLVLGWDVQNPLGESVRSIVPGAHYEFVIYYRVDDRLSGNWDTFLHLDGSERRYNGDHATLGGRYPFALWAPGDYIADRHRIELEPHYAPGTYKVYFGLYSGSRRLEVRRGPHEENRIIAGTLEVR